MIGMRERGGRAKAIAKTDIAAMNRASGEAAEFGATIHTDDHPAYNRLHTACQHGTVNHSAKAYVNGLARANGIESVCAVLKRGCNGAHHNWSVKHQRRQRREPHCPAGQYNRLHHAIRAIGEACRRYLDAYKNNPSANGRVLECLVCGTLARAGVVPFHYQARFALVPNADFDVVCYDPKQPVVLSMKASLRERYKQAGLEGAPCGKCAEMPNAICRPCPMRPPEYQTTSPMATLVKPIALNMVAEIAHNPETQNLPISGMGGVTNWQDAVDFIALGATTVQVCTAAMVYGFRIVEDMIDGLSQFLDEKGMDSVHDLVGKAIPSVTDWQYLNLNYIDKAHIDQEKCIQYGRCHIVCEDTAHQAITHSVNGVRRFDGEG